MGGLAAAADVGSAGLWLFPAIAVTAVAVVISGFVALRPRGRPPTRPEVVARGGDTSAMSGPPAGVDYYGARLAAADLVTALAALDALTAIAQRDRINSEAVIAVWCEHLRRDPALRDERVARSVQQRLCTHLKRVSARRRQGRATMIVDLRDTQLHDLDLDGIAIGELSLARARLTGTTRLGLLSWGGLDASEAYFGGDVLAEEASVERRWSLRAALIEGSLDLEATAVFGELDMSGSEVAQRTSMSDLVCGTLRLTGIDRGAVFGGAVDLSRAVAVQVLLAGDEFTAGVTITPPPAERPTILCGDEVDLVEQVREALEAPLQV